MKETCRNVLCYGLSVSELEIIRKACGNSYTCVEAECLTDIATITGNVAEVMKLDGTSDEEKEQNLPLIKECTGCRDTLYIIGDTDYEPKVGSDTQFCSSAEEVAKKLHGQALKNLKRKSKGDDIEKMMMRTILILRELRSNPGVTTEALAEKLEVSHRTVQRYMHTLQAAEVMLEYDRSKKGWFLIDGVSDLLGDFNRSS